MTERKQGILLHFDAMRALSRFTDEEAGRLLRALFRYADPRDGAEPDFSDAPSLDAAWPLLAHLAALDDKRFAKSTLSKQYAQFVRYCKAHNEDALERGDWELIGAPTYKRWVAEGRPVSAPQDTHGTDATVYTPLYAVVQTDSCIPSPAPSSAPAPSPAPPSASATTAASSSSTATAPPITAAAGAAADTEIDAVIAAARGVAPRMTRAMEGQLRGYCGTLGAEVVRRAISASADAAKPWAYILSVLARCEREGITSGEAWDRREAARRAARAGPGASSSAEPIDRNAWMDEYIE